jgi:hypothetical protein
MAPYAEVTDYGTHYQPVNAEGVEFQKTHSEITSLETPTRSTPMEIKDPKRSWENLLNVTNQINNHLNQESDKNPYNTLSEFTEFLEKADPKTQEMLTRGLFYGSILNNEGHESIILAYPTKKIVLVGGQENAPEKYPFNMVVYNKTVGDIRLISGPENYFNIQESPTKYILETLRGNADGRQEPFDSTKFIKSFIESAPVIKELADLGLFETKSQTDTLLDTFSRLANSDNESIENPIQEI